MIRLHRFLTAPTAKMSNAPIIFWLSLSLTFAVIYGLPMLQRAFSSDYVVASDARQFVFWMGRFSDSTLFPNDLIADYFQSVTPWGYTAFYQLLDRVGIEPLLLHKLLPIVLGVISTTYCFGVCMQILPVPLAGFIATVLLNQNLWMDARIVCAVPRSFAYPLFLAFLYYLLRRSLFGVGIAIALLGLFYPQCVFICAGILLLQVFRWEHWQPRLSQNPRDYWFCGISLGVAFLVMLPYALQVSDYEPVISVAEARTLPEFSATGRTRFFVNSIEYWLFGERSGIFSPLSILCGFGVLLPMLLRNPWRFPLAKQVNSNVIVLAQTVIASLVMFFAAHALLFKLHLPNRYTHHSLVILMAIAAGIALTLLLDTVWQRSDELAKKTGKLANSRNAWGATVLLGVFLVFYPGILLLLGIEFPHDTYKVGDVPQLYEFFQQQPKDTLIASLADEANKIPTFSQRSILVGRKYAIPYHMGYYRQFRQRTLELIHAQYTPDLAEVKEFIKKYGVDFWMLETEAFNSDYLPEDDWIQQYQPAAAEAQRNLERGAIPALATVIENCSVLRADHFVVLEAKCILNQP